MVGARHGDVRLRTTCEPTMTPGRVTITTLVVTGPTLADYLVVTPFLWPPPMNRLAPGLASTLGHLANSPSNHILAKAKGSEQY